MFLSDENLLKKQSVAGKVFAVRCLYRSLTLKYTQSLVWFTHGSGLYSIIPGLFEYLFAKQDYDSRGQLRNYDGFIFFRLRTDGSGTL